MHITGLPPKTTLFNPRPPEILVDTLIIHSMYAKGAPRPFDPERCIQILEECQVSAHYLIDRRGCIRELVPEGERAWHAGKSVMPFTDDPRGNVNDFSIGIELLGNQEFGFCKKQYQALARLTKQICKRHPIRHILGHEHIAPGRKTDPGPAFDWQYFGSLLIKLLPRARELKSIGLTSKR